MTNIQKNEISQIVRGKIDQKLGGDLARKSGVSRENITQIANGNWDSISDMIWLKVAKALDYNTSNNEWQIAVTHNFRMIQNHCNIAKGMLGFPQFTAISHKAGGGKTAGLTYFYNTNKSEGVYYIQARAWAKRDFLLNLAQVLGIIIDRGYNSVDTLGQKVINHFKAVGSKKPLLIVDEADKLRPSALKFFIELYNEMEDKMGCIIAGTENLKKEIKNGVKYHKNGYDEIDDRFGRVFQELHGVVYSDVQKVCEANGYYTNEAEYDEIWKECNPIEIIVDKKSYTIVESYRRLKKIIQNRIAQKALEYDS